jgi:exopolysaccharide biosynthesis WecB/TagA/CpsF family protein
MTAQLAAEICPEAIVWGIGGGTVRIFAGTMREAPVLWRRLGLQWLYRLLREPRQLWHRYLIGNPLFGLRILKMAWRRERPAKCPK